MMAVELGTAEESFLKEPRHAIVATNRAGKSPQISPVWYWWQDGVLYISLRDDTAKYHNLRKDPHISVCVDGGRSDTRYLILHGQVEIIPNGEPLQQEMRWRIIRHYHADEDSARVYYEASNDGHPVLIRFKPTRVLTHNFA